ANGSAGRGAIAGDHIDYAIRKTGFLRQSRDPQRRERRLLGWFQYDGAPRGQSRPPLPGLHQQWEVPGDDLADNAKRFMPGIAEKRPSDGDRLAVNLVGPAGVVAVALDGERQVRGLCVAKRFAIVERFQGGQIFLVLFDQVRKLVDESAALG